ncbi:MAG: type 1 glutamine amidotransferase domain-containing protein [Geodermatophilaceae bacterium]
MSNELHGRRIAFLVANSGVEQVELTTPWQALRDAGAETVLIAPEKGTVQAFNNNVEEGDTFDADVAITDADPDDYDGLVLPGGTTNPDKLRMNTDAVSFVAGLVSSGKPVAAICHGPWTLVEADVLRGKSLASWPSLQTDIRNAGGQWHDVEVFSCPANGWTLVSSRKPDDLEAFTTAAVQAFAQG